MNALTRSVLGQGNHKWKKETKYFKYLVSFSSLKLCSSIILLKQTGGSFWVPVTIFKSWIISNNRNDHVKVSLLKYQYVYAEAECTWECCCYFFKNLVK